MNRTTNYNLPLPLETEFYDIDIVNEVTRAVDAQMKANADAAASAAALREEIPGWAMQPEKPEYDATEISLPAALAAAFSGENVAQALGSLLARADGVDAFLYSENAAWIWQKWQYAVTAGSYGDVRFGGNLTGYPTVKFTTFESYTVSDAGKFIPGPVTGVTSPSALAGKYFVFGTVTAGSAQDKIYKAGDAPKGANCTWELTQVGGGKTTMYGYKVSPVQTLAVSAQLVGSIASADPDAYTENTVSGGVWYVKTGASARPLNAVLELGSYVGTGACGEDSPNTLSFGITPRLVLVETSTNNATKSDVQQMLCIHGASKAGSRCLLTWGDKSLSWYYGGSGATAEGQFNKQGTTYHYIAIGSGGGAE